MNIKSFFSLSEGGSYFFTSCSLIVFCFFITELYGRYKIIGLLSILAVLVLIIEMFKKNLFKNPFIVILFILSLITGIGLIGYIFFNDVIERL